MGTPTALEPALPRGAARELCSVGGARLLQDATDVELDGVRAAVQPVGDLAVGEPLHDQAQHVRLEIAQLRLRGARDAASRIPGRSEDGVIDRHSSQVTEHLEEVEPVLIPVDERSVVELEHAQQLVASVQGYAKNGPEALPRDQRPPAPRARRPPPGGDCDASRAFPASRSWRPPRAWERSRRQSTRPPSAVGWPG